MKRSRKKANTTGHTPGPWSVDGCSDNNAEAEVIVADDGRRTICWTANTWDDDEGEEIVTDEDRANGRLIAAAPELLSALRLAADSLRSAIEFAPDEEDSAALQEVWSAARAAIAKATGEAD